MLEKHQKFLSEQEHNRLLDMKGCIFYIQGDDMLQILYSSVFIGPFIQGSPQCRKCRLPDQINSIKKNIFFFWIFFSVPFVVSFHLCFKNGWLTVTDFVIYWLLVSVVYQMNIFLRKNVPDIT